MLRIGITGGIGSGKTTVANLFARQGIPVIDSDVIARSLLAPGEDSYNKVVNNYGESILRPDKSIDRTKLKNLVFSNKHSKKKLEEILHPEVRKRIVSEINKLTSSYCIIVVPLLIEAGFLDLVDRVLVIITDKELQISRVVERDGMSREEIIKIINSQSTNQEKLEIADDVINNDEDNHSLIRQVEGLHKKYMALSLQSS